MSTTTFSGPVASQNGFIENSFTTAERDAIASPSIGLLIYNTETNVYEVYNGTAWQSAFGPGPTPPVSFPVTLAYLQKSTNTIPDQAVCFSPDGTTLVYGNGSYLYYQTLSTPWDITTATGSVNLFDLSVLGFTPMFSLRRSVAWGPTGQQLFICVFDNGSGVSRAGVVTLGTPYNISTAVMYTIGNTLQNPLGNSNTGGVTMNSTGTVAYVCVSGYVLQYNLPSPYDWLGATTVTPLFTSLSMYLGLYNNPQQFRTSSDGTIGFVYQSGASYQGQITQFQMSTPFDVTTINPSTPVNTTVGNGIGYVIYGGIDIKPDNSALYVTGLSGDYMTNYCVQYTVS